MLFGLDFNGADALFHLVAVVFLLVLLLVWRLRSSTYGRALIGLRENERRMRALGYDTTRLKLSAFVLAGAADRVRGAPQAYSNPLCSANDRRRARADGALVVHPLGGRNRPLRAGGG